MIRYLLDTCYCIEVIRNRSAAPVERFNTEADALCISTVVLTELLFGAAKSTDPATGRAEVQKFADRLEVLAYDEPAAHHTGLIRADLRRRGATIDSYDAMIAGQARSRGLTVVTGNLREFQRVDDLQCEDWSGAPFA